METNSGYEITSMNDLDNLVEMGFNTFNTPYIQRQFLVRDKDILESLIKRYKTNFAFSIKYKGKDLTLTKKNNFNYIRDEKKWDRGNVSINYDLKSNDINDIIEFAITN